MSTPQRLELDPNADPLDFKAIARALDFYPMMTWLQDWWDKDRDGPKQAYFGMAAE